MPRQFLRPFGSKRPEVERKWTWLHSACTVLAPKNKKITIMTQILVTLNEDATTQHVRKAIELLRGVASVKVFKGNAEKVAEKRRQEAYVKESLTRAFDEVKRARRGEHKMMTDEEFMAELKAEGIAWRWLYWDNIAYDLWQRWNLQRDG